MSGFSVEFADRQQAAAAMKQLYVGIDELLNEALKYQKEINELEKLGKSLDNIKPTINSAIDALRSSWDIIDNMMNTVAKGAMELEEAVGGDAGFHD